MADRQRVAAELNEGLGGLEGLSSPRQRPWASKALQALRDLRSTQPQPAGDPPRARPICRAARWQSRLRSRPCGNCSRPCC
ncbi:MAG: hypothetical protein AAGE86_02175 [Pseudomonadota bacterium]